MAFKEITSKQNHFIKYATTLKDKKRRDIEKSCLIEGQKILEDLADKDFSFRMFFISQNVYEQNITAAEKIAKKTEFNFIITDNLAQYLSTTETAAGFLAVAETPVNNFFEFEIKKEGCYILLDNIQDPGNAGTIFRSCAAFSIAGVILYGNCTDPYSPKTIRASQGQTLLLPSYRFEDTEGLQELSKSGLKFYGAAKGGDSDLADFKFPAPLAICLGNESKGLSEELLPMLDGVLKINMSDNTESLNVSVAGSIIAYQYFNKNR